MADEKRERLLLVRRLAHDTVVHPQLMRSFLLQWRTTGLPCHSPRCRSDAQPTTGAGKANLDISPPPPMDLCPHRHPETVFYHEDLFDLWALPDQAFSSLTPLPRHPLSGEPLDQIELLELNHHVQKTLVFVSMERRALYGITGLTTLDHFGTAADGQWFEITEPRWWCEAALLSHTLDSHEETRRIERMKEQRRRMIARVCTLITERLVELECWNPETRHFRILAQSQWQRILADQQLLRWLCLWDPSAVICNTVTIFYGRQGCRKVPNPTGYLEAACSSGQNMEERAYLLYCQDRIMAEYTTTTTDERGGSRKLEQPAIDGACYIAQIPTCEYGALVGISCSDTPEENNRSQLPPPVENEEEFGGGSEQELAGENCKNGASIRSFARLQPPLQIIEETRYMIRGGSNEVIPLKLPSSFPALFLGSAAFAYSRFHIYAFDPQPRVSPREALLPSAGGGREERSPLRQITVPGSDANKHHTLRMREDTGRQLPPSAAAAAAVGANHHDRELCFHWRYHPVFWFMQTALKHREREIYTGPAPPEEQAAFIGNPGTGFGGIMLLPANEEQRQQRWSRGEEIQSGV